MACLFVSDFIDSWKYIPLAAAIVVEKSRIFSLNVVAVSMMLSGRRPLDAVNFASGLKYSATQRIVIKTDTE